MRNSVASPGRQIELGLVITTVVGLFCFGITLAQPDKPTQEVPSKNTPSWPRMDIYGDPLPEGALQRLGSSLLRFSDYVTCVTFTPNGKQLLVGTWSGEVDGVDPANGRTLFCWKTGLQGLEILVVSPDGKSIAIGHNGENIPSSGYMTPNALRVDIFELATRQSNQQIDLIPDKLNTRSSNPGEFSFIADYSPRPRLILFTPDSKHIILGGGERPRMFDVETGEKQRTFFHGEALVYSMVLSSDGSLLATCASDQSTRIWDMSTGKIRWKFPAKEHKPDSPTDKSEIPTVPLVCAFSQDDKTLAVGDNFGWLTLWNAETGQALATEVKTQSGPIVGLAYVDHGATVLTRGSHRGLEAWDAHTLEFRYRIDDPAGSAMSPQQLAITKDESLAATCGVKNARRVHLFDLRKHEELFNLPGSSSVLVSILPGARASQVVLGSFMYGFHFWDYRTGQSTGSYGSVISKYYDNLSLAPDGLKWACVARNGDFTLFNSATGKPTGEGFNRTNSPKGLRDIRGLDFTSDGKNLIWSLNERICCTNMTTGEDIWTRSDRGTDWPSQPWMWTNSLLSADRKLVVGVAGSRICLLTAADGNLLGVIDGLDTPKSDDYGGVDSARLFDVDSHRQRVTVLSSMPIILALDHGAIHFFSQETTAKIDWQPVRTNHSISGFHVSPDDRLIIGETEQGLVLVDLLTRQKIMNIPIVSAEPMLPNFTGDMQAVVSAVANGTALVWSLDPADFLPPQDRPVLDPARLEKAWEDLASPEPQIVYQAQRTLVRGGDTAIELIRARMAPVSKDPRQLAELVTHLVPMDPQHAKAEKELLELGWPGHLAIQTAIKLQTTDAARHAGADLLNRLDIPTSQDLLRSLRIVAVLEWNGGQAARKLLGELARPLGPEALTARDAQASLRRLERGDKP